jgi:effector-binding domain-containing protein
MVDVRVETVEACPIAGVEGHATHETLPMEIGRLVDRVWAYVRREDVGLTTNHNVVLYLGDVGSEQGADIIVGVQVDRPFEGGSDDGVRSHELPGGAVVRAVHVGPYNRMKPTYDAILAHADEHGLRRAGPSWEIYGDWDDDPTKLETDIFFLLAPST